MQKQKRLQPPQISYILDAAILILLTFIALIERDYTKGILYFDWLNLYHYIPLYVTYIILVLFYNDYKRNRVHSRYIIGSLGCCLLVAIVWPLFFYNAIPQTKSEEAYEQTRQNRILLNEESIQKITHWVDEDSLTSAQLIDSCRAYNAECRAAIKSKKKTTEPYWQIFLFFISNLIILATVSAVHFPLQVIETENKRREAEKLKIEAEHKLLKYQLNPHFLMNTLNNIHAQIDINHEEAQESVRILSKMMRYMLYETNQDFVPLAKEVDFLSNYFEMMRKRYIESVSIELIVPENIPNILIPPALFINLAENAFKHGITYDSDSFLRFELSIHPSSIACNVSNSKIKKRKDIQEPSGFGIDSLLKRLELIYPGKYTYNTHETDDTYSVNLTIPIV